MISKFKRGHSPLFVIVSLIIAMILLPSLLIAVKLFNPPTETWEHIKNYLLADYLKNSLILVTSTAFITGILGTFFGWMIARYKWKFSALIELLLIMPMAIPPYIAAYVYGGILTPYGTLDRIFMSYNMKPIRFDIMSMGGAIFVFSVFLLPYVFLVTRSFFQNLPSNMEESSRLLGKTKIQTFFKVILPMSRGAIIGGIVLVALEVLNDYGLVKYFGIPTFSTAIYKTWFGLSDVDSAIRLAANLMVIVILILLLEQFFRGRGRTSQARALANKGSKKIASKFMKIIFSICLFIYLSFSFFIPVLQLISWSKLAKQTSLTRNLDSILQNTLLLAIIVTIAVIVCGILIANLSRLRKGIVSKIYSRVVVLGYSIPASIIAIAVLVFFISLDRSMHSVYSYFGLKKLFLTSSAVMLGFALIIRFMAIGFNNIESGMSKIGIKYYEASKLLGKGNFKTFFLVDMPMLKTAIISGAILTFIDVLKELPLTLILRPFNFDTLATRVFTYAGDEMIHEASVYSLMIIGVSVIALIAMLWLRKGRRNVRVR